MADLNFNISALEQKKAELEEKIADICLIFDGKYKSSNFNIEKLPIESLSDFHNFKEGKLSLRMKDMTEQSDLRKKRSQYIDELLLIEEELHGYKVDAVLNKINNLLDGKDSDG